MALQYVIKAATSNVEDSLKDISDHIEIFNISDQFTGVSVPTKVSDDIGDATVLKKLDQFDCFDLYSGKWLKKKRISSLVKLFTKSNR